MCFNNIANISFPNSCECLFNCTFLRALHRSSTDEECSTTAAEHVCKWKNLQYFAENVTYVYEGHNSFFSLRKREIRFMFASKNKEAGIEPQ